MPTKPDHIFMMAIIDLLPSLWAETKTTEQNGSEYATVADICKLKASSSTSVEVG